MARGRPVRRGRPHQPADRRAADARARESLGTDPHEAGCCTPRRDRGIARDMASVPRHLLRGSRQPSVGVVPVTRLIDRMPGSVQNARNRIICERPPAPAAHDSAAPIRRGKLAAARPTESITLRDSRHGTDVWPTRCRHRGLYPSRNAITDRRVGAQDEQ
jgi:hypothetical protein